jgi:hypothetical protein
VYKLSQKIYIYTLNCKKPDDLIGKSQRRRYLIIILTFRLVYIQIANCTASYVVKAEETICKQ